MRVDRIQLHSVKLPLGERAPGFFAKRAGFEPNWIPGFIQSEVRFYLLRLVTDEGHEGVAAMPSMATERDGLGSLLGNYLLGINPLDHALVNQRIQEFNYLGMRNGWIEGAFWDLIGKIRGEPLWKVLGGEGGWVRPYASTGANHGHDPKRIREIARTRVDEGYRGVKLRVKSEDVERMVDFVAAARDEVGDEVELMVDANQGWPVSILDETPLWDLDLATRFAKAIEPLKIAWLEEPLNRGDLEGLAELRRSTSTPIAGGEMSSSWRELEEMLRLEALDVYQPDAVLAGGTYAGGVSVVYWLVRRLRERGLKFCPHTWTTGLGFTLGLHLVGLVPQEERGLLEYPIEGPWRPEVWSRFLKNPPLADAEGRIHLPDGPGLGVEVDWDVVSRFGRRVYDGSALKVAMAALRDRGLHAARALKEKKDAQRARSAKASFALPEPPF
jgi:L-alanine-DL-glutamate epimerase-like enolase superfamily enzyme